MRILIVDNQPLFIDALRTVLAERFGGAEVLVAATVADALDTTDATADLAIVNVERPVCRTPRLIADLVQEMPNGGVIGLVGQIDMRTLREVMRAGAQGLLPRTADRSTVQSAIAKVLSGGRFVPEELADAPSVPTGESMGRTDGRPADTDFTQLTPRQRDVLQLLAQGQANQEIASELGIALATVKLHVNAILRSLKVRNRTEAAAMAIVGGLIDQGTSSREMDSDLQRDPRAMPTSIAVPTVD